MIVQLREIATVQMGYSFRAKLESSNSGTVAVIQMKDLSDNNIVDCMELIRIDMDAVKEHHLVEEGDLIFRSRGLITNSAILHDNPGVAIVAAPLIRIRISDFSTILPSYLNWYISQRDSQKFFTKRAKGSVQKMISKNAIEDLGIMVPAIEKQRHIVELALLSAQEQSIMGTLAMKREQYITSTLINIAKGE